MVREYELMFIVRPELDEEALQTSVDSVRTLVEGQGGEVTKTTMWGRRRLAYEVRHAGTALRDGHYVIFIVNLDSEKVAPVERALRIHDTVFRHLLVIRETGAAEADAEAEPGAEETRTPRRGEAQPAAAAAPAPAPAAAAVVDEADDEDDEDEELEPVAAGRGEDEEE